MPAARTQDYVFYRKYLLNIMLIYKGRQDIRMFLEILLSLFTVSIFGFFAIKPTSVTIASLITDIKSKEEIISRMDQKIQNLTAAQQLVTQNQSLVDILNFSIPDKTNLDTYVRQIEGIAGRNQVSIQSINSINVALLGADIEDIPDANNKQVLVQLPLGAKGFKIAISVSAPFPSLMDFLKGIENLRRPLFIDSVQLNSTVGQNQQNVITMTVSGRLPYIK